MVMFEGRTLSPLISLIRSLNRLFRFSLRGLVCNLCWKFLFRKSRFIYVFFADLLLCSDLTTQNRRHQSDWLNARVQSSRRTSTREAQCQSRASREAVTTQLDPSSWACSFSLSLVQVQKSPTISTNTFAFLCYLVFSVDCCIPFCIDSSHSLAFKYLALSFALEMWLLCFCSILSLLLHCLMCKLMWCFQFWCSWCSVFICFFQQFYR